MNGEVVMKAVYKKELLAYFTSPVGYAVLAAALCAGGFFFGIYNLSFSSTSMLYFFSKMSLVFVLLVPLVTMHLWAEERKNHTDQLLLTSGASVGSMVLGKYLASLTVFSITVAVMLLYPLTMSLYGTVVWSYVLMMYLGYFLMGCALLAVGVFVSSVTESQIVAAVISFAVIMVFKLLETLSAAIKIDWISSVLIWFSVFSRFDTFILGVADISTFVYYITFSALFVFLAVMSIEKRRWS